MNGSLVSVESGHIRVLPAFVDMLMVQRLGGRFNGATRAWLWPATRENAMLLAKRLRAAQTTPEFAVLLAPPTPEAEIPARPPEAPVVEPSPDLLVEPPEPDIVVPEGMLTRPWRHQKAAFKFCTDHFTAGMRGILLAMGMGTGKSLVACMLVLALVARRVLIACPLRVVQVWITQFERHVGVPVMLVPLDEDAGSVAKKQALAAEKMKLAQALGIPFIGVINYDAAWRDPFAAWAEKVQWDLAIADECVPTGTMVATPAGSVPIELLKEGEVVLGLDKEGRITKSWVTATFRRFSSQLLVQIDSLLATENHPVWVEGRGYIEAANVRPGDRVRVHEHNHDCLRVVRSVVREDAVRRKLETSVLQQGMLGAMEDVTSGVRGGHSRETRPPGDGGCHETQLEESGVRGTASRVSEVRTESVSRQGGQGQGRIGAACEGLPDAEWRERNGVDRAAEDAGRPSGMGDGVHRSDEDAARLWIPGALQAGYRESAGQDRGGSRWTEPPVERPDRAGCEEGRVPGVSRLDRRAGQERGGSGELRGNRAAHLVFNLETSTGNYFANGILVHNCHRLKAPGGKASLFFKRMRLHANHRVALTGTPMPHGPMDIYAQFRFLDVTIFGPSFSAFRTKYAVMGGYQRKQITGFQKLDELEASMSRITFRVGPEVLDLPPATHVTYYCDLTPEAARIYRDLEEDFVARVKDGTVTAANALVKLLRLQQVVGGCVPTDDHVVHRVDSNKQKLLADTLEDIGKNEPVVVFCRFHADLDAVHQACEAMGYCTLELSGRRDQLKRWQDGEAQVLAVQISAGGVGVDFTRARFAMYYSLSFSLGEYDQALARVHRPGQTRPVEHIHLVARSTVDVKIMRALEKRAEIVQSILAEIKQ
jgi:superfamily II DNA or RNA helicase